MAPKTHRFTIALDDDSVALLRSLEQFTGLTPAQTIAKLFPSHLEELWTYLTWLRQLPEGPSLTRSLGLGLLHSYGPETLVQAIKKIDPGYVTEGEQFGASVRGPK